jgi:hypothetical protein
MSDDDKICFDDPEAATSIIARPIATVVVT